MYEEIFSSIKGDGEREFVFFGEYVMMRCEMILRNNI